MYQFMQFLVLDDRKKVKEIEITSSQFKASYPAGTIFPVDSMLPLIDQDRRICSCMVHIDEVHLLPNSTVVFFRKQAVSGFNNSIRESIYRMWLMMAQPNIREASPRRAYSSSSGDHSTSTMDPALAMSLGMDRDADEVADRAHRGGGQPPMDLAGYMRAAGNVGFDPDDDDDDGRW